jgi:uncharacterized membrane-anchored protein
MGMRITVKIIKLNNFVTHIQLKKKVLMYGRSQVIYGDKKLCNGCRREHKKQRTGKIRQKKRTINSFLTSLVGNIITTNIYLNLIWC